MPGSIVALTDSRQTASVDRRTRLLFRCGISCGVWLFMAILSCDTLLSEQPPTVPEPRWWKGNLQTQSYWSDGDLMPEDVLIWYREHGFHFVALSDHDRPQFGDRWKRVAAQDNPEDAWKTVHPEILEQYRRRHGDEWVETRERDGSLEVRLKPMTELAPRINVAGEFLVMPSHQIHSHVRDADGKVLAQNPGTAWLDIANSHIPIVPASSTSPVDAFQKTVNRVQDYAKTSGRRILLGLAHPNYDWGLTAEDIVSIDGIRFMEIYTALSFCNSQGDEVRPSVERVWDIVLTRRLAELNKPILFGLASDDAHTFQALPGMRSWGRPGRGWISVRCRFLTPESIFAAMDRGDFYASSGVVLKDVRATEKSLSVTIDAQKGVRYVTEFVGTRRGYDRRSEERLDAAGKAVRTTKRYSADIGIVLKRTESRTASYRFRGDEIYVRARITSSRPHPDPSWSGQAECAWTQPVVPRCAQARSSSLDPLRARRFPD